MLRRARWYGLAILLGLVGGRGGEGIARAGDGPEASGTEQAPAGDPEFQQWFDVGSIVANRTHFAGEMGGAEGPFATAPDTLGSAPSPLDEAASSRIGSITEVVDLINQEVRTPTAWEREGVTMAEQGIRTLCVRASESTLARIQAFLAALEREATRTVTLDAVVVRGNPWEGGGPGGLAGAVARGALEPLVGARAVGMSGQRIEACTGGERAHMAEPEVPVAVGAKGTDPVVAVLPEGLALRARTFATTGTRARGTIQASWASPAHLSTYRSASGDGIEPPRMEGRSWNTAFEVVPDVWTLLPSSGGVSLAIRVHVAEPQPAAPRVMRLARLPTGRAFGPLEAHRWDLSDLRDDVDQGFGSSLLHLTPSNFMSSTPEEPPEPPPVYPGEGLSEAWEWMVGKAALEREGASLRLSYDTLWGTVDRESALAVDRALAALRGQFLATTRLRSTVLALPLTSFPEYLAGPGDDAPLLANGCEALLRRPGARVLDRCALRLLPGQRGAVVGGTQHAYVADYDVRVAEKGLIGIPTVRVWLEGLSFDVRAERSVAGNAVWCEMRLQRSTARETRQVATPYGAIECPSIGVQRVSGAFALPIGGSRIVAAHLDGGVVTLVIVSAVGE